MKKYIVQITALASQDLEEIYTYIAAALYSCETANRQCRRIIEKIESLKTFPNRNRKLLFKNQFVYHKVQIDNYTIFYTISENKVIIVRILYSASDLISRLENNS